MKASGNKVIKIISTEFIVLVLFSLLLFWLRLWCNFSLLENAPDTLREAVIRPSHLVPETIENDPNVTQHSSVSASFSGPDWKTLGILSYFLKLSPIEGGSFIYDIDIDHASGEWIGLYFDKRTGLFVSHSNPTEVMPDGTKRKKPVDLYAGPNGISEVPDKKLGRFSSPLVDRMYYGGRLTLYDKNSRRFFSIDFDEKKVAKGPQLSKNDIHKPVQIGSLEKRPYIMSLDLNPPLILYSEENAEERSLPAMQRMEFTRDILYHSNKYLLVLDETNRIYLLDRESLEFAGSAGYLAAPDTLFETQQRLGAKDLLSYQVYPVSFGPDQKYMGIFTASLNREGTALALSVFDPNGHPIVSRQSGLAQSGASSIKAIYFGVPWGPVLTICKYALENLQPVVLSLASYFTANIFDAGSSHRGLFILPDSFVAMMGRYSEQNFITRFFNAICLILPSIALSILLAILVDKDASLIGLSDRERRLWKAGTIAFGITAYITYRLTKPKITLVTCQNCGKQRRPDMDRCHHCRSEWHVPELTPPSWRVIGSA
jgi:hypothetical protein